MIKNIGDFVPTEEILAQLAEECSELSQSALKLRRALMVNVNPTPSSIAECIKALEEEYADTILCMTEVVRARPELFDDAKPVNFYPPSFEMMRYKRNRWIRRMEE